MAVSMVWRQQKHSIPWPQRCPEMIIFAAEDALVLLTLQINVKVAQYRIPSLCHQTQCHVSAMLFIAEVICIRFKEFSRRTFLEYVYEAVIVRVLYKMHDTRHTKSCCGGYS